LSVELLRTSLVELIISGFLFLIKISDILTHFSMI